MQKLGNRKCAACKIPGAIAPELISSRIRNEMIVNMKYLNLREIPPKDLEKFKKCLGYDVSHNRLNFSQELCHSFKYIRYLNVSHNQLNRLPQNIGELSNLVVFDASSNQIAKLPMSIYMCRNLQWMDVSNNPFLETWMSRKGEKLSGFDPESFAEEIKPFMLAVKEWKQTFIMHRAEEMLEFLVICPVNMPSKDDAKYDLSLPDYGSCPFYSMLQNCPAEVEHFLDSLPKMEPSISTAEKIVISFFDNFGEPFMKWFLRKGLWCVLTALTLCSAFMDTKTFGEFLSLTLLPQFVTTFLMHFHSELQEAFPVFPIKQPAL